MHYPFHVGSHIFQLFYFIDNSIRMSIAKNDTITKPCRIPPELKEGPDAASDVMAKQNLYCGK